MGIIFEVIVWGLVMSLLDGLCGIVVCVEVVGMFGSSRRNRIVVVDGLEFSEEEYSSDEDDDDDDVEVSLELLYEFG